MQQLFLHAWFLLDCRQNESLETSTFRPLQCPARVICAKLELPTAVFQAVVSLSLVFPRDLLRRLLCDPVGIARLRFDKQRSEGDSAFV